ncbi:MAG TPA: YeeE/YedE thiosulfate transporter family protein, partial [Longimicrobiales bacterium]|nr:YeeE/YedE thiosulfate transporter family protein [Longimicrobiales bacterium]
ETAALVAAPLIGIVLLAAYVVTGRGLGASGAFSAVVANATVAVQGSAASSAAITPYVQTPLWRDWIVLELAGVALGAFASAYFAGRLHRTVERGPRVTADTRLVAALAGGALMGIGAKLARGCTSGQALTGGALLSVGSWTFIATTFAAGYLCAPLARRLWR